MHILEARKLRNSFVRRDKHARDIEPTVCVLVISLYFHLLQIVVGLNLLINPQ